MIWRKLQRKSKIVLWCIEIAKTKKEYNVKIIKDKVRNMILDKEMIIEGGKTRELPETEQIKQEIIEVY